MDAPGGIAESADGSVWVADQHEYRNRYTIAKIVRNRIVRIFTLPNAPTRYHLGALVATDNEIGYVAPARGRLGVLDTASGDTKEYSLGRDSIQGIVADSKARIWITTGSPKLLLFSLKSHHIVRRIDVNRGHFLYIPYLSYNNGHLWFAGYYSEIPAMVNVVVGWVGVNDLQIHNCGVITTTGDLTFGFTGALNQSVISTWEPNTIHFISEHCIQRTAVMPRPSALAWTANGPSTHLWAIDMQRRQLWQVETPKNF